MTTPEDINDILKCIANFDQRETLKNKGRYFEVIWEDIIKLLVKCGDCRCYFCEDDLNAHGVCKACSDIIWEDEVRVS